MKVEIELPEIKPEEIREEELTLMIRNYSESKIHVSLEIVQDDRYGKGYITLNLEELRKALDKIAL